ncbi:MAG: DUF2391 domain-containing protein [Halobacteriales archaeon]|nr:DUF2391 domain-containing protein [Halobacteriales archaeon]
MTEDDSPRSPSSDTTNIDAVLEHLGELENTVDDPDEQREVRHAISMVESLPITGAIENYTTRDMAQAFVGSILFTVPLLVEGGVEEIGAHFLESTPGGLPVFLLGNAVFAVFLTGALLYWADIRDVRVHKPLFGVVPRRLLGVLVIAFITSTFTMTLWGRVEWSEPVVALSRISVVWTVGCFGGALGDILPGETGGEDINEILGGLLSGDGEDRDDASKG